MAAAFAERGIPTQSPHENGGKPLLNEARALGEFFNIQFYPIYYGIGVPHDHKSPVLTIPGFTGNDLSLFNLNTFLGRINYNVHFSGIAYHRDPEREIARLSKRVKEIHKREGQKVHIVGHSLGEVVGRGVCQQIPDEVASLTVLGGPFGNFEKDINPFVLAWARIIAPSFSRPEELKERLESLFKPLPERIKTTYIYTKEDGVIHWQSTIDSNPQATNIEVPGTHSALVANPHAYKHLANALADAI